MSTNLLKDRVDIVARDQFVAGQAVHGAQEVVVARDVACMIKTVNADRVLSLLGSQQNNALTAWFDPSIEVKAGWQLRVSASRRNFRYSVRTVAKYPSPHDCQFQVAELSQDLALERA